MSATSSRPVALVTGASRRVGRAVVLELARNGHDVLVHYHQALDEAEHTVESARSQGVEACSIPADLGDPAACDRLVAHSLELAGRVDVLVNNASSFEEGRLQDFDARQWSACLQLNLIAPAHLCHAVAPAMNAQGGGCIVNISDIITSRPRGQHLAYGVSKAGLDYLTRALARQLAPHIRVNGVAPGIAVFPEHYEESLRRKLVERVPLQRAGTPEDTARTVCFLVQSPYITGQIVAVDGGRSIS